METKGQISINVAQLLGIIGSLMMGVGVCHMLMLKCFHYP